MTATDPYATRSLHGTLPLVRDEGSPGGVRLAVIGKDAPEDCVAEVRDLPDAEMTLRVFADDAERRGYLSALAEHGGNAFSALESPDVANGFPFALILRHDRSRGPGETLDEAVRLVGSPRAGRTWSDVRRTQVEAGDQARVRAAHAARWAAATRTVGDSPGAFLTEVHANGVDFLSPGHLRLARMTLREVGGDPVLDFDMPIHVLPADLAAEFAAAVSATGAETLGRGRYRVPMAATDVASLAAALGAVSRIGAAQDGFAARKAALGSMADIAANAAAHRVLVRLSAGYLLLQISPGDPAAQASPRNGAHQAIPGTLVRRLVDLDLVRLGWLHDGKVSRDAPESWCPGIYVPTAAGLALAQGKTGEAAALAVPARPGASRGGALHRGSLCEGVLALRDHMPDADLEAMGEAVGPRLPAEGLSLADAVGRQRGYDGWCPLVQGVLAGRIELDDAMRVVHVPAGPGPAP